MPTLQENIQVFLGRKRAFVLSWFQIPAQSFPSYMALALLNRFDPVFPFVCMVLTVVSLLLLCKRKWRLKIIF